RARRGLGRAAVPPGDPDRRVQRPPDAEGGSPMSAASPVVPSDVEGLAPPPAERSVAAEAKQRLTSPWASLAALVIAILWTVPTAGLLITSFRPVEDINSSGWWSFFTDPNVTLDNYRAVFTGDVGLSTYLVNSIVITLPAVLIPIA